MKTFTKTTVETFEPIWGTANYSTYTGDFIRIRSQFEYKCKECFKCDKPFRLDDTVGIDCLKNVGNKVLCKECAEEMLK